MTEASWSSQCNERARAVASPDDVQQIRQRFFAAGRGAGFAVEAQRGPFQRPLPLSCRLPSRVVSSTVDGPRPRPRAPGGSCPSDAASTGWTRCRWRRARRARRSAAGRLPLHGETLGRDVERALGLERVPGRAEADQHGGRPARSAVAPVQSHAVALLRGAELQGLRCAAGQLQRAATPFQRGRSRQSTRPAGRPIRPRRAAREDHAGGAVPDRAARVDQLQLPAAALPQRCRQPARRREASSAMPAPAARRPRPSASRYDGAPQGSEWTAPVASARRQAHDERAVPASTG